MPPRKRKTQRKTVAADPMAEGETRGDRDEHRKGSGDEAAEKLVLHNKTFNSEGPPSSVKLYPTVRTWLSLLACL